VAETSLSFEEETDSKKPTSAVGVAGSIPVGVSAAFDGEEVICTCVYTESVG
jgi:hypothetical protein